MPPQEDVERLGEGAGGSLLPHEIEDLPVVPSGSQYDVYYFGDEPGHAKPLVRFAPIIPNSGLHRRAAHMARLVIGRSLLTDPTPRGHDGGASEYRMAGFSRVKRHGKPGEGVTFYGPLRNALGREGSSPNNRHFHREIELRLDEARADMAAEIEKVWPDDVGAELDLVARLRRGYEYEGQRASTAASATFGLLNRWHRDRMDEKETEALSWTTVVALDLATVVSSLVPPEPRRRGRRGKRQERGTAPYQFQLDEFVREACMTHLGEEALEDPPPAAGTPGGPTWCFALDRAVKVGLGGKGYGVVMRFRGAATHHATFHDATYSRARCLCGLGMYNKSHIIGPLWYRLEQLMREVIVATGLPVDDLADLDEVEARYHAEALHALDLEPGTHPRDALAHLARLARGGAAPEEPAEPPERVYDDADDAVDDIAIDGLTI